MCMYMFGYMLRNMYMHIGLWPLGALPSLNPCSPLYGLFQVMSKAFYHPTNTKYDASTLASERPGARSPDGCSAPRMPGN